MHGLKKRKVCPGAHRCGAPQAHTSLAADSNKMPSWSVAPHLPYFSASWNGRPLTPKGFWLGDGDVAYRVPPGDLGQQNKMIEVDGVSSSSRHGCTVPAAAVSTSTHRNEENCKANAAFRPGLNELPRA
jgi:hypothetical protein